LPKISLVGLVVALFLAYPKNFVVIHWTTRVVLSGKIALKLWLLFGLRVYPKLMSFY